MMSNRLEAYAHLTGQTLRTGFYAALYRFTNRRAARMSEGGVRIEISRPMPSIWSLLQDVLKLQAQDARNVREGIYPAPIEEGGS
ncbi:MAG TPA: hypothetical protein VE986_06745, partial [Hyphomicrobiales bacterium]|nr:hypothetical protein [Hyphomicrobiales bacterium]